MENLSNQDMIIFRLNQIRNEELTERTELNTLIHNFWTIDKKYELFITNSIKPDFANIV